MAQTHAPALPSFDHTAHYALFLDVDGTLATITDTPDATRITPPVLETLERLNHKLEGALALISGRSLHSIDSLCAPRRYSAAGQHGLEIRHHNRITYSPHARRGLMQTLSSQLEDLHQLSSALLVEHKGLSIAVHYRKAPELGAMVKSRLEELIEPFAQHLYVQQGKMVCELRMKGADKGSAVDYLLQHTPFKGRTPIFAGDDVTDEDAFRVVNAANGISIKIGEGETDARFRVASTEDFEQWLVQFEQSLDSKEEHEGS